MVRQAGLSAAVFGVAAVGLALACGSVAVGDDKFANTDTIMTKTFNKKKGNLPKLADALKAEKWDDAQKAADTIAKLAADLGKNAPPKGSPESWKKLSAEFAEQAKAIATAAAAKDAKATKQAIEKFTAKENCNNCHSAHQKD